jgi:hypothetical protein
MKCAMKYGGLFILAATCAAMAWGCGDNEPVKPAQQDAGPDAGPTEIDYVDSSDPSVKCESSKYNDCGRPKPGYATIWLNLNDSCYAVGSERIDTPCPGHMQILLDGEMHVRFKEDPTGETNGYWPSVRIPPGPYTLRLLADGVEQHRLEGEELTDEKPIWLFGFYNIEKGPGMVAVPVDLTPPPDGKWRVTMANMAQDVRPGSIDIYLWPPKPWVRSDWEVTNDYDAVASSVNPAELILAASDLAYGETVSFLMDPYISPPSAAGRSGARDSIWYAIVPHGAPLDLATLRISAVPFCTDNPNSFSWQILATYDGCSGLPSGVEVIEGTPPENVKFCTDYQVDGENRNFLFTGGQRWKPGSPACSFTWTPVDSTISGTTTWRYGYFIHVSEPTVVEGDLVIEPDVVVKFDPGASLTVTGSLTAEGTDYHRIIFSSVSDDAHGGDNNWDGRATSPQAGNWNGIVVGGNSSFKNCSFFYAGGGNNPVLSVSEDSSGVKVTVEGSVFAHNKGSSDSIAAAPALDLTLASGASLVSDCIFYDNLVPMGINPAISIGDSNDFDNALAAPQAPEPNKYNGIFVRGSSLSGSATWAATQVPFVIGLSGENLDIATEGSLAVGANVTVKLFPGRGIVVAQGGVLTAGDGASFTSIKDDSRKGDTNGDGATTPQVADYWSGISVAGVCQSWESITFAVPCNE